jgi:hypothetical protein
VICLSNEDKKYFTSLISINYKITKEEKEAIDKNYNKLDSLFFEVANLNVLFDNLVVMRNRLPNNYERIEISEKISNYKKEIAKMEKIIENLNVLWKNYEYLQLSNENMEEYRTNVASLKENMTMDLSLCVQIIKQRNQNIDNLISVKSNDKSLYEAIIFYENESNYYNYYKFQKINNHLEIVNTSYFDIKKDNFVNETEISKEIEETGILIGQDVIEYSGVIFEKEYLNLIGKENLLLKKYNITEENTNSSDNNCKLLLSAFTDLKNSNDASDKYKNDRLVFFSENNVTVNETLLNYDIDVASKEIEYNLLISLKQKLNITDDKLELLNRIDSELKYFNDFYNYSNNTEIINVSELYKMSVFDTSSYDEFISQNCKDNNFSKKINISKIEYFFSNNMTDILLKKQDTTIPDTKIQYSSLANNTDVCCTYGDCFTCCDDETCREKNYPTIYVHGHAFNNDLTPDTMLNGFSKMQTVFTNDKYINAGKLDLAESYESSSYLDLGRNNRKLIFGVSYFYISYYNLGSYSFSVEKDERIENYAIRLREIISLIKYKTGAKKVNIIAHSMGGLVVRDYISLFGSEDVDKIITINTPHHGVSGRVEKLCPVFGSAKACEDLNYDSIFLKRIDNSNIDKRKDMYVIRSIGCSMKDEFGNETIGDGIVTNASGFLLGANNLVINGNCTDALNTDLHNNVLDPDKYPETYEMIKEILK